VPGLDDLDAEASFTRAGPPWSQAEAHVRAEGRKLTAPLANAYRELARARGHESVISEFEAEFALREELRRFEEAILEAAFDYYAVSPWRLPYKWQKVPDDPRIERCTVAATERTSIDPGALLLECESLGLRALHVKYRKLMETTLKGELERLTGDLKLQAKTALKP